MKPQLYLGNSQSNRSRRSNFAARPLDFFAAIPYGPTYSVHPNCGALNPDSGVPADAMSEEQTFRIEVNGSLPLSGQRSSLVQDEI